MAEARPLIVGSESGPEPPFPLHMEGKVIKGFGRGSKELGIPTANLPVDADATPWISDARSGVYFGWASLDLPPDHADRGAGAAAGGGFTIFPMVMSIGYNPFYNNTVRSAEVHLLDTFADDFYGVEMRVLILGYIRDEKNYDGLEALIQDIKTDCEVARRSIDRNEWKPASLPDGKLDGSWLTRRVD